MIEYAGDAIRALDMAGRMTVCNMSIEGGARAGMIAPDETTFDYIARTPDGPKGAALDARGGMVEDAAVAMPARISTPRSALDAA